MSVFKWHLRCWTREQSFVRWLQTLKYKIHQKSQGMSVGPENNNPLSLTSTGIDRIRSSMSFPLCPHPKKWGVETGGNQRQELLLFKVEESSSVARSPRCLSTLWLRDVSVTVIPVKQSSTQAWQRRLWLLLQDLYCQTETRWRLPDVYQINVRGMSQFLSWDGFRAGRECFSANLCVPGSFVNLTQSWSHLGRGTLKWGTVSVRQGCKHVRWKFSFLKNMYCLYVFQREQFEHILSLLHLPACPTHVHSL